VNSDPFQQVDPSLTPGLRPTGGRQGWTPPNPTRRGAVKGGVGCSNSTVPPEQCQGEGTRVTSRVRSVVVHSVGRVTVTVVSHSLVGVAGSRVITVDVAVTVAVAGKVIVVVDGG
jgi:hypothetical protein